MSLFLVATAALAGSFYHPNDIAAESRIFEEAARRSQGPMEAAGDAATRLADALTRYEEGLDLLGTRASEEERERLAQLRKDYNRAFAQLQAFADAVIEDFDSEFTQAMERAVQGVGGAVVCERMVASGRALPGMPSPTKKNPACVGTDANAAVAGAMDTDPVLRAAVDEIAAVTWPTIELSAVPQAPVRGTERWIDVHRFVGGLAERALRDVARDDRSARGEFELAIAEGASPDELRALVEAAQRLTDQTTAKRAAVALPIIDAAERVLSKWSDKGEPTTGWCAQPTVLGGCIGPAADIGDRLAADKKVRKAAGL